MNAEPSLRRLPFFKMHGGGNDFVLVDHRQRPIPPEEHRRFARRVCAPKVGVGADGLILIEDSLKADFRWRFYNADGSEAEMCGNGARCAARFAVIHGLAGPRLTFETLAGLIEAEVMDHRVRVALADVGHQSLNLAIPLEDGSLTGHFMKVGVPHVVVPVANLEEVPVRKWGRGVRFHEMFQPGGTNVNFIGVDDRHTLHIRTYERGVEDETLACGTGAVASAIISATLGKTASPVSVHTRGGEILAVSFQLHGERVSDVFLEGEALVVYQGELWLDELK
ncbi:MAG: diaminopimelate epimerase [Desulfobaccales bacterium]